MSEVYLLLATCGQSPPEERFSVPQKEMTNAAKSGAEINKAHYAVKKKVRGKEIR